MLLARQLLHFSINLYCRVSNEEKNQQPNSIAFAYRRLIVITFANGYKSHPSIWVNAIAFERQRAIIKG